MMSFTVMLGPYYAFLSMDLMQIIIFRSKMYEKLSSTVFVLQENVKERLVYETVLFLYSEL